MGQPEKNKYPALRIIAAWYKTVGYVVGGIFLIAAVIMTFVNGPSIASFGLGAGAVIFIIMSMSIAEIIQVFLDTESSTRSSANSLKELVDLQKKPEDSIDPAKSVAPKAPAKPSVPISKATAQKRPAENRPKLDESQIQSIKNLIKHLHNDGLTTQEIVRELKAENIQSLYGEDGWTGKAVHDALLAR